MARRTQAWLTAQQITPAYIAPAQPWQNGVVQSFLSRLRDECLDPEWFSTRTEAAALIEAHRQTYNATDFHACLWSARVQTGQGLRVLYAGAVGGGS